MNPLGGIYLNRDKQINEIVSYFKRNEKEEKNHRIGVEFEHFVVDKNTLRTINYYEEKGIKSTLSDLMEKGWRGKYEGEHLIGLERDGTYITLEPAAQLEISIKPHFNIQDIEKEYLDFLKEVVPILDGKNQYLISLAYHPESKIKDIPFIPKERYKYMSEYFRSRGKYAHNMMKGTAATQVTFDYCSEEDYVKKFKVANLLSPVIAMLFDNGPFFEGDIYNGYSVRTDIWNNCDSDRCGVNKYIFDKKFGYRDYAEYLLDAPPIILIEDGVIKYTKDTPYKDLFNPNNYKVEDLEHIMTMVFPDVRTKKFIEIRMADSVPYPMNLAMVALWKGLIYNSYTLNLLYEEFKDLTYSDVMKAKLEILKKGFDAKLGNKTIYEISKELIILSSKVLDKDEIEYLVPLCKLISEGRTAAQRIKDNLHLGKGEALKWCILNHIITG